jgi:argininosuccinate lyase
MLDESRKMFHEYFAVDRAHTVMLAERGIITPDHARQILQELQRIEGLGPHGFPMDPAYDSFLPQIERAMAERIGEDVAGRMHTGRSRIDHDAAVLRLFSRNQLLTVFDYLLAVQQVVLRVAGQHVTTLMPGYTHLQHAQPWTFGHYLARQAYVFDRDADRLRGAYAHTNLSSLGGAALAGTSWPLDRQRTCELLGHDAVVASSHDAGCFSEDYRTANAAVLAILVNNAARVAGDIYVWHTWEFQMVEVDGAYCGTSSIMPQKKNADACECIRGLAGRAMGWLPAALGMLKGATSTDCDSDFVPDVMSEAADTTWRALDLLHGVLDTLTVKTERMRERAGIFWSTASNLADTIVRERGLSFRTAHHVVAALVRLATEQSIRPDQVTARLVDEAARATLGRALELPDAVIRAALDPEQFMWNRATQGSIHPDETRRLLADCERRIQAHREWREATAAKLARADEARKAAVAKYLRG